MIHIRPERPEDAAAVYRVNEEAFAQRDEADLVESLRDRAHPYLGLVAEVGGEVVGYVAFSPVTLEPARPGLAVRGLAPMAVLPDHQGQGVGTALGHAGLAACREAGCAAVVVLGYPDYYGRFGFVPASTYGVGTTYEVPDDLFMAVELVPGALDGIAATAHYHPAFAD